MLEWCAARAILPPCLQWHVRPLWVREKANETETWRHQHCPNWSGQTVHSCPTHDSISLTQLFLALKTLLKCESQKWWVIYINRYIENKRQQFIAPSLTRGDLAKQSEFYLYPGQYVRRYRLAGAVCNFLTYCVHVYMFISHDVSCDVSLDLTIERSCSFRDAGNIFTSIFQSNRSPTCTKFVRDTITYKPKHANNPYHRKEYHWKHTTIETAHYESDVKQQTRIDIYVAPSVLTVGYIRQVCLLDHLDVRVTSLFRALKHMYVHVFTCTCILHACTYTCSYMYM